MSRQSSFNLDRFKQDLLRVESSLGKPDFRKTANSPLLKEAARETKAWPLDAFKRELSRKELAKSKINLELPYDQLRPARADHRAAPKPSNYRFSELSGESREADPYSNVRQKLLCWRGEEVASSGNSKVIQKSEVDESQYYEALEKTMETPANEQQEEGEAGQRTSVQQLLGELTRRNEVYERVERQCKQERSYYRRNEDLSIRLQDHFRQHRTMRDIVHEIKRLSGLDAADLQQLYSALRERQGEQGEGEEALL